MINGTSLHPMFLPGVLQPSHLSQVRMGFDEEIGSKHMNMTAPVPLDGEARLQTMLALPDHCTSSNQASNPIHSETSSGFQSTIQAHFTPFPLRVSSEVTLNMIHMVANAYVDETLLIKLSYMHTIWRKLGGKTFYQVSNWTQVCAHQVGMLCLCPPSPYS